MTRIVVTTVANVADTSKAGLPAGGYLDETGFCRNIEDRDIDLRNAG
jgi:hypothetical protein